MNATSQVTRYFVYLYAAALAGCGSEAMSTADADLQTKRDALGGLPSPVLRDRCSLMTTAQRQADAECALKDLTARVAKLETALAAAQLELVDHRTRLDEHARALSNKAGTGCANGRLGSVRIDANEAGLPGAPPGYGFNVYHCGP